MKRFLRAVAVVAGSVVVGALGVQASDTGGSPQVSSVDAFVVAANGQLGIHGSHFYSEFTSDCTLPSHAAPFARFFVEGGTNQFDAPVVGTDAGNCNNGFIRVQLPPSFTGAAHVVVYDGSGQDSSRAYVPEVTAAPSGQVNPTAGPLGAKSAVQGSGLQPLSAIAGTLKLHMGSTDRPVLSASDTRIDFDPQNESGAVNVRFSVFTDFNDHSKTQPIDLAVGTYNFQPPTLDPGVLSHQQVGSHVNLTGHNLGSFGSVVFPGGARGQVTSWGAEAIGVNVPAGAQPGVIQAFPNGYGGQAVSGPSIELDPKLSGMSPTSGSSGGQATITGYNFGGAPGTVSAGGATEPIVSWSDQAVVFGISNDTDTGLVVLTRADGASVPVSSLSIVPHVDRLETNNIPAGSQVVVDGASLGASQGRATVGPSPAQPLLWSRDSVLLQLPANLAPGTYPVTLTSAAGAASNSINLTVVPGPTPKANATAGTTGAVAPSFDNNHDFVKPIRPPSPVFFNITVDPHKVPAGATADIVVTLKLNGKPLPGAAVKLAMLFTPGNDYVFTPDSGVTDANGVFNARVKISKNPGDSVIAATSGVFSDQDHVAGTGSASRTAQALTTNPAHGGGFAPLILLGVVALGLVAAGFYLNMRSMGA